MGFGGSSPPVSGKRVGTDDHLTPSSSSSGCSAPGAASLPGGGLGAAALSLSPERKHLLSRPNQAAEPRSRASSGDHVGLLLLLLLPGCFSHVRLCTTPQMAAPRLLHPWDSPGKNAGVGCHFLLQCMHARMLSRFRCAGLCATPWTGSSVYGIL